MVNIFKTFLIVFIIFFSSLSFTQTQRNPVLEYCTGTWCQFCPDGHSIIRNQILPAIPNAIIIGYHGPANGSDPFSFFPGNTILSSFGFSAYPTGIIDRVSGIQSRSAWPGLMNTRNSVPASVSINMERSFNQNTREFNATIDFTALTNLSGLYNFNVILLESGMVWSQVNGGSDYVHTHVVRSMMNGALGQEVINGTWNQNDVISKTFNYTVPVPTAPAPDMIWDSCHVVVLVYKSGSPLASNGEIQQAIETTLMSPDYVATISSLSPDIIDSDTTTVQFDIEINNEGLLTDKYNIELETDIATEWTAEFTTVNGTFSSTQIDSVEVVSGGSTIVTVSINPNGFGGAGKTTLNFVSRNNSGNQGSTTSRFVTNTGVNVLIVDAEEEGKDYESFVTGSLENVYGGTYGVVSRSALVPAGVDLSSFDIVFWQGSNSTRAFYENEVSKLESYLDGGGNLLITGQDIGSDIFETSGQSQFAQDFYHNYLHTDYVANISNLFLVKGIANDIISNGIQFIASDIYTRSLDKIAPRDTNAVGFLTYFNGPDIAGVRAAAESYRVVYMVTGLEQITEQAIRDTITARSISWLAENVVVGVNDKNNLPVQFNLDQNYPNPLNPSTRISFSIPEKSFTTLKIYDILGNEIATLLNEEKPAGYYELQFDASKLSSGVYLYKLQSNSFVQTKKMILLK